MLHFCNSIYICHVATTQTSPGYHLHVKPRPACMFLRSSSLTPFIFSTYQLTTNQPWLLFTCGASAGLFPAMSANLYPFHCSNLIHKIKFCKKIHLHAKQVLLIGDTPPVPRLRTSLASGPGHVTLQHRLPAAAGGQRALIRHVADTSN